MPQINLSEEFDSRIQERLKLSASTEELVNHDYKFDGADTVHILSVDTMPMTDYKRNGTSRYGTPRDIGDTEQVMILSQDKAFTGIIDKGDVQDQKIKKSANECMKRQTDEKIKPMVEMYRLQRMEQKLGHKIVNTSLTEQNAYKTFLEMQASITNARGERANRVCIATPTFLNLIKTSDFVKYSDRSQEMVIKGIVGEIDGAKVVEFPEELMPNGVVALWGNKKAVTAPEKLKELVIHENPPGINGNLLEGRIRYDAFVLDTKVPLLGAIYEAGTLCEAPTIKYTAGSTNTIAITSATSGATIKYTLDGSDPRDSLTAQTYSAAISTADWSGENGTTKVRAYAHKDGTIDSLVTDEAVPVAVAMTRN